ncbi:Nif3-like dinuclear metal center hexameric protein [Candidatus Tachikawaea gelatinosa]|uniref:GTP cyclohydrolase 1 type 2 homolog n=1 Tax=Candidatus Tachikawaea gelatinosa TaxID=1410383 RepID=A0A090ARY0_9ENTR|nr:Nif3-like dinuclear metal center hexameric protein [Candidatus Tachikawaea gelatinosa]BAP58590.1 NIF3 family protein [Candidatus Tachikawaea gelatinosa]
MNNLQLEKIINQKINKDCIKDYLPNGLQIEGRKTIKKIITGVTANQELINKSIELNADAIIVHHGFFWKNECPIIKGMKKKRLTDLLKNNINLYSWHLPLDIHPYLGNNKQLANLLNIKIGGNINTFVNWGTFKKAMDDNQLLQLIKEKLMRIPLHCKSKNASKLIKKVAWCCGKGQNFIDTVINFGNIDAFITGEVSEQTFHSVCESNLHFFSAGHHATEVGGIKALGQWLSRKYKLDITFINISNPF